MSLRPILVGVLTALIALVGSSTSTATEPRLKVVADGLDNPRGLDVSRRGAIYVTEAGRGGSGPCRPRAGGRRRNVPGARERSRASGTARSAA